MSELEQSSNLEHLDELGLDAIENMGDVQPIENLQENLPDVEKPEIRECKNNANVSFSGGNCICSCDLTCTRA